MAAKIFLTGATGYLGGEVLYQISQLPANHHIRCLVRTEEKAQIVQKAFPNVETTIGDLDDTTLIEKEALAATIVLHLASTRHEPSTRAIIKGLTSPSPSSSPKYWIQIGGASMFATREIQSQTYGSPPSETYNDLTSHLAIINTIKSNPSRVVDNLVITQPASQLRTALVAGPIIYGKGRGPVNTTTMQGPAIATYTLKNGHGFTVNKGENVWSTVHVSDVGSLLALLVTAAAEGRDDSDMWNENGIYLPENGSISFHDFASKIAQSALSQNLITSTSNTIEIRSLTPSEVDEIMPHGAVVLGTNARLGSSRARKYLGWEPKGISLDEDIPLMVKEVAEKSGK